MTALANAKSRVSHWLFDQALPLWAQRGVDGDGRFYEHLDFDGRAVTGARRRTRVQARQIYVFCEAAALGWDAGRAVAQAGLEGMIATCRRDDGLWVAATDDSGAVVDETADLYDLAFVLFALAAAHRVLGDARARSLALETLAVINRLMAAPHGGWREALPSRQPRRQNPHMHLLEAMLAWQATAPDPAFEAAAGVSLDLCRRHFLVDGAIREYFTADWTPDPATGHIVEPGHFEEWAWLLRQAEAAGLGSAQAAEGLHRRAVEQGLKDGFMIREMDPAGAPIDAGRRLWAQTEAIRTALVFRDVGAADLIAATFDTHLATAVPGLWIDSYDAEGRSADKVVPASSLYHLMTAFSELLRTDA
ncbi:AGE family epimerase/isomerase [Brevundimonas sp.]|jgi:mannose/cellobiose epimerase-like protein (N-acyl-D-glucosamine 2-epimerase family)|uniref:AGE family epimerase/isomerase n=1 Tax=Brevundimonas sp. TaxID=1871086 RepID=UPI0037C055BE